MTLSKQQLEAKLETNAIKEEMDQIWQDSHLAEYNLAGVFMHRGKKSAMSSCDIYTLTQARPTSVIIGYTNVLYQSSQSDGSNLTILRYAYIFAKSY